MTKAQASALLLLAHELVIELSALAEENRRKSRELHDREDYVGTLLAKGRADGLRVAIGIILPRAKFMSAGKRKA